MFVINKIHFDGSGYARITNIYWDGRGWAAGREYAKPYATRKEAEDEAENRYLTKYIIRMTPQEDEIDDV